MSPAALLLLFASPNVIAGTGAGIVAVGGMAVAAAIQRG